MQKRVSHSMSVNAAGLVRIVGQVEVAFTFAFSRFYLGERMMRSEGLGLILVVTGVVLALAGAL